MQQNERSYPPKLQCNTPSRRHLSYDFLHLRTLSKRLGHLAFLAIHNLVMGMVWCKALAPWSQNSGNGHEAPPSCTSCSMGVCVDRCCDICCQGCVGCFGCLCPRDCLYTFCAMIARLAHYCSVGQKPEPAYAMPGSQKCFSVGEEV
ncbi:uncharacterized protein LOC116221788 isoform X2 [Clupea harengus]|uniref:Uncharacterized protein LOC116221788 isoform X2 n=1 Tax=Clupea harengus TaxID=7950 RepID=A0A6P8FL35_CLUHA|nr:uncharacterized protein LOC116221788 isoform X2 [Clupea harengus]